MYFIYDCNGKVIGNTKGYRTFKGAQRQQNHNLGIQVAIRLAFDQRADKNDMTLCSIKRIESNS